MGNEEMTGAEEEWVTWANSQNVDTGSYCTCAHEGLGVGWHLDDCRGASFALRNKVMELMRTVDTLRSVGRPSGDTPRDTPDRVHSGGESGGSCHPHTPPPQRRRL